MRKILVATHGYLADGIKSSINILCGDKDNISYINAYVDEKNINEEIDSFFKNLKNDDEAVIFTDILGGSVNQLLIPYCRMQKIHLISGFNLAIILEIIMMDQDPIDEERIDRLIESCRKQLIYIKETVLTKNKEDSFF